MTGSARIIRGNALALPLLDSSVDLVVTSPPYFGLRSYQDGGEHYAGQIGAEPTPVEFVDALIAATREMLRVLKPSGSIWVNLGDKYSGGRNGPQGATGQRNDRAQVITYGQNVRDIKTDVPSKSLIGIPWRYALRCIDDLGLILRAEVIWSKPNGLPESVTDRVRRSHETWFHFVKQPRYSSAVDEIREASQTAGGKSWKERKEAWPEGVPYEHKSGSTAGVEPGARFASNPLGKLPGSVWSIPTQPLKVPPELGVDHFAAFPMEWPRRIIQGWSPSGVCSACGEGRRPVAERTADGRERATTAASDPSWQAINRADWKENVRRVITGYVCSCPDTSASTVPAVVLDPFGGTGTTALVAKALGRDGISVDMSADYCRLAEWRINDPGQMAAAMQVEKPDVVHPDQLDLFADL